MRLGVAFATIFLVACGTDVDLGGGAAPDDAGIDVTQCGDLVAPAVDAACRACDRDAADCQPNGCYGGYWCNAIITDCHAPPKTCP